MSRIFISYRRQDSSTMTGRIYDKLEVAFGSDKVFRDIDDIGAGQDFRSKLASEIDKSDILLVIIGREWAKIKDTAGNPRLDDPNDFVRIEVEAGLKRQDKIVIPVLIEGALMPKPDELPESLRELCFRNAVNVRQDPDFRRDIEKLILEIRKLQKGALPSFQKKPAMLWAGLAVLILLVLGIVFLPGMIAKPTLPTPTPTSVGPSPTLPLVVTDTLAPDTPIPGEGTPIQATDTPILTPTPQNPVRVGIIHIPDYEFPDVIERLQDLGFTAEWISISSDYATFAEYDIVYLPIGWAFQNLVIEGRASIYQRFVEEGGGLIVEQPNYGSTLTPDILPYKLTFKRVLYNPNEVPPRIVTDHEILNNVELADLPGPGCQLSPPSNSDWIVVTSSADTNTPTLVVASYIKGRIAVLATSISTNSQVRYQVGDNLITNLILWVSRRPIP